MINLEMRSRLVQKCIAECLGVFIICTFGNGSVAENIVTDGQQTWLGINIAYGLDKGRQNIHFICVKVCLSETRTTTVYQTLPPEFQVAKKPKWNVVLNPI
jgi:hypothetical protein